MTRAALALLAACVLPFALVVCGTQNTQPDRYSIGYSRALDSLDVLKHRADGDSWRDSTFKAHGGVRTAFFSPSYGDTIVQWDFPTGSKLYVGTSRTTRAWLVPSTTSYLRYPDNDSVQWSRPQCGCGR